MQVPCLHHPGAKSRKMLSCIEGVGGGTKNSGLLGRGHKGDGDVTMKPILL